MSDSGPAPPPRISRLRRFGLRLIYSKKALWGIGVASFLEALIVPIPLETILFPLLQARRRQVFLISTIVLIGCLLAAMVGYGIGRFVFGAVGSDLVSYLASPEQFEEGHRHMNEKGFWYIFTIGITPVPFQIATLAAGATGYSPGLFLLASTLSRGIRYYGLALLVLIAGNRAQRIFERHKKSVAAAFLVIFAVFWAWSIWG
jgi:membrane protein YqaA with SNARE-associated domain